MIQVSAILILEGVLCSSGAKVAYTQHGRAYNFFDLSNAQTMNAAFISAIYSQLITPPETVKAFVSPLSVVVVVRCKVVVVYLNWGFGMGGEVSIQL